MTITIERLRTTLHSAAPVDAARADAWQAAFAAQDGAAIAARFVRDDQWLLIRQLRVVARWPADAADFDVGCSWALALHHAIDAALARGDAACLRYQDRRDALADLLYRSAFGESARQWAWRRLGLLARDDISCAAALEQGIEQLLDEPDWIWPVLQRIVAGEPATASLTGLLRALPTPGWRRLLHACERTRAFAGAVDMVIDRPPTVSPAALEDIVDASAFDASPAVRQLLGWAAARAHFAQRHHAALTVLLAALAWPVGTPHREGARRRTRLAWSRLASAWSQAEVAQRTVQVSAAPPEREAVADRRRDQPVDCHLPGRSDDGQVAEQLPVLPDTAQWQTTDWAGALFWLGRIAASGAFEWLESQPERPADGLPLLLREIARALQVPEDDPAFAVFCGGTVAPGAAPAAWLAQAGVIVAQWSRWLAQQAADWPEPRLARVCRRSGRLRIESGWIELHLPLAEVELTLRRLGLDLDPGWLPWLGCVLRIHYDD